MVNLGAAARNPPPAPVSQGKWLQLGAKIKTSVLFHRVQPRPEGGHLVRDGRTVCPDQEPASAQPLHVAARAGTRDLEGDGELADITDAALTDPATLQGPGSPPHRQEAQPLVAIAEAVVTGRDHVELAVNARDEGKIPNLPFAAVVEVSAVMGRPASRGAASARCRRGSPRS